MEFNITKSEEKVTKSIWFDISRDVDNIELQLESSHDCGRKNQIGLLIFDAYGDFRGWLTPEFSNLTISEERTNYRSISGYIPDGKWEIVIATDLIVCDTTYKIKVKTRRKTSDWKWFKGEIHSHTLNSDGKMTTQELIDAARERLLDFIFLTDHNMVSQDDRSFDKIKVFPGTEITTYEGHALALGINKVVDPRLLTDMKTVSTVIKSMGGILGIAHPFFPGSPYCGGCRWTKAIDKNSFDFLEVFNSGGPANLYPSLNTPALITWFDLLNHGFKVSGTSGGDIHSITDFNESWLPLRVYIPSLSLKPLLYAIKMGRCYASREPFSFNVIYKDKSYSIGDTVEIDSEKDEFKVVMSSESGRNVLLVSSMGIKEYETHEIEDDFEVEGMKWILGITMRKGLISGFTNPIFLRVRDNH